MGWRGALIGGCVGSLFGGPVGAGIGALFGHWIEKSGAAVRRSGRGSRPASDRRMQVFCASAAAMLAKIAKADGRVSAEEISRVEVAFARLGFSSSVRAYAVDVFRRAKDDNYSIYEYAADFTAAVGSVELRELFYELLWDVACADGRVTAAELAILRQIPAALHIRQGWFQIFVDERLGHAQPGRDRHAPDPLAEAYAILGASPGDSDAELRRKYRELAKRNHPDALRAQGLPEGMVSKATERMSRINVAWSTIKERRGL